MLSRYYISAATLLALLAPLGAAAFNEPEGFGKVKFGATPEEFLKAYPKAVLKVSGTASAQNPQSNLVIYRVEKQAVGQLKDCRVDFRFFGPKRELFDIQFLCLSERDKVSQQLIAQFGTPTKAKLTSLTWTGTNTAINFNPKNGAFNYGDIKRSKAMQFALMRAMGGLNLGNARPSPSPAPTEGSKP